MRRYRNSRGRDPYWTTAKFAGKCGKCGAPISKGERAFYYPNTRTILTGECAESAASEFAAAVHDEDFLSGNH